MSSTAHNQCHWNNVVLPDTSVINSSVDSPLISRALMDKKNDDNNCHLLTYDDDPHQTYKQDIYIYIKEELLEASHNSPIDIALRLGHYNTLGGFMKLISHPELIINLMWEDPEDGFKKKNLKEFECDDLLTMYSFINWVLNQGLDITRQTATTFDSFVMYEFNISKPTAYEEGNEIAPHLSSQIITNTYQRLYALQICTGYKHWNNTNWQPRDDIEYGDFRPYIASTRGLRKDYQERAYSYILDELLYAAENKESVLALKEYGITSLRELLELIRTPGSIIRLRYKDQNDDKDKMLHEEQYRELLALYSYFNLAQIMYGPIANGAFNIFKTTRNDFKDFVDVYFDESKPIIYGEDGELLKQLSSDERCRVDTDINFGYGNSDSTLTPTACDNKWWQYHYF